jgi:hypothetical protein
MAKNFQELRAKMSPERDQCEGAAPSPWLRSSLRSFLRHRSGAPRPLAHELPGFVAGAPLRSVRPGSGLEAASGWGELRSATLWEQEGKSRSPPFDRLREALSLRRAHGLRMGQPVACCYFPIPVSSAACGLPRASSVTLSEALLVPAAPGVKITLIAQFLPAATGEVHVFAVIE